MNIQATGDSGAYLQLAPASNTGNLVSTTTTDSSNSEDVLDINLDSLNDDAVTKISPAFTVTNSVGSGVGVRVVPPSSSGVTVSFNASSPQGTITSYPGSSGDTNNLSTSGSFQVDIEIDTTSSITQQDTTIEIDASTDEYNA
jgi:hypothetical protein